jgi:hypothetical protein
MVGRAQESVRENPRARLFIVVKSVPEALSEHVAAVLADAVVPPGAAPGSPAAAGYPTVDALADSKLLKLVEHASRRNAQRLLALTAAAVGGSLASTYPDRDAALATPHDVLPELGVADVAEAAYSVLRGRRLWNRKPVTMVYNAAYDSRSIRGGVPYLVDPSYGVVIFPLAPGKTFWAEEGTGAPMGTRRLQPALRRRPAGEGGSDAALTLDARCAHYPGKIPGVPHPNLEAGTWAEADEAAAARALEDGKWSKYAGSDAPKPFTIIPEALILPEPLK